MSRGYMTAKMARDGVKAKAHTPIKVVNGDAKTPVKKAEVKKAETKKESK